MTVFDDKIEVLKQFNRRPEHTVMELAKEYEPEIVDFVTDEQLFRGKDSEGQTITPAYRPLTIQIKSAKGQPTDRVTLKDTGAFHRSIEVEFRDDQFAIVATDRKVRKLEGKYGTKILGLNDDGQQELIDMIRPDLIEALREQLC